ncbi:hypothetical protein [Peptostreptococcus faecalis]|uniref:hypothetical protein n=1 Tax=Peptostreptococcus faecalis TaxID=2045015 RepID=UPI000C7BBE44|nr:hypothetical protein [Peptostreptococcus faecalis]
MINWHNIYNDFIIQLKNIENMYLNSETKLEIEQVLSKDVKQKRSIGDALYYEVSPIIYRILLESREHDSKEKSGEITKLYEMTDKLMEASQYSKFIYENFEIKNDEVIIKNDNEAAIKFFTNCFAESNVLGEILHKEKLKNINVLVNLCIIFENMCSKLLKTYYLNGNDVNLIENKSLSFKELKKFDDIEESRVFLVDSELDRMFRESFVKWYNEIKKVTNIESKIKKIDDEKIESINELYQRRNLLVHADGIVNSHYIKNVDFRYVKEIKKGIDINHYNNKEYLLEKMKTIEEVGTYIFCAFLMSIEKDKSDIFNIINKELLKNIKRNNNAIPEIYKNIRNDKKYDEFDKMLAEINYYLFFKVNNKYSEVEEELEKYNVRGKGDEFKIAKKILQNSDDCVETTIKYLEKLDTNEFFGTISWPLMKVLENKREYNIYCNKRINKEIGIEENTVLITSALDNTSI